MSTILKHVRSHLLLTVVVVLSLPLFFVQLGAGSLHPWDEAWYAAISRDLFSNPNPWVLRYNQAAFFDHPPLGFQLKAISIAFFSESTFSVRLPEVLAGILCVMLVFMIAKQVGSEWSGVWAALALVSSRWFLFRSRSGNLDITLLGTQLFILWVIVNIITKTKRGRSELSDLRHSFLAHARVWLLWFGLGVSLLVKSLISLQLVPIIVGVSIWYWWKIGASVFHKQTVLLCVGCVMAVMIPLAPWLFFNLEADSSRFIYEQIRIGLRGGTEKGLKLEFILKAVKYFSSAVYLWFFPMLVSFVIALLMLIKKDRRKISSVLLIYTFFIGIPYIISEKTEIWHLIPIIGAAAVSVGVMFDWAICDVVKFFSWRQSWVLFARVITTVGVTVISAYAIFVYSGEFLLSPSLVQNYEKITRHISYKSQPLYTVSDAYFPALVYYARLDRAPVQYLSNDHDVLICQQSVENQIPIQVIVSENDWFTQRFGTQYIVAREGDVHLAVLSPEDCAQYLVNQMP